MGDLYGKLTRFLLWERQYSVTSEEDFVDFHETVSLSEYIDSKMDSRLFPFVVPLGYYAIWATVCWYERYLTEFVSEMYPHVFTVVLMIVLQTLVWFDQRGKEVVLGIRDAFDTSERQYFSFMGLFVERLYEPFHWTRKPGDRSVHRPTAVVYAIGFVLLVGVTIRHPGSISYVIGTDWGRMPWALKLMYFVPLLIAGAVATYNLWVDVVGAVFLGKRIAEFPVKLDVTRLDRHLGLNIYSAFIFRGLVAYLIVLTIAGVFVVQTLSLLTLSGYVLMTLFPVVGTIGAHYGLYKSIRRSKADQLEDLKELYEDEMEYWFQQTEPPTYSTSDDSLRTLILAKREIERIPDWPFDINQLRELAVLIFASNASVIVRVVVGL